MRFYDIVDIFDGYNHPWTIRVKNIFLREYKESKKAAINFYIIVSMWLTFLSKFSVRVLGYHRWKGVSIEDTLYLNSTLLFCFSISVCILIWVIPFCIIYYLSNEYKKEDIYIGYEHEDIHLLPYFIAKDYIPTDIIDDNILFDQIHTNTFISC